jgi:Kef-type K+ transport system membrane component KefB
VVDPDEAVRVVALLGLAFLLFLAGLEIELRELRGPRLRLALLGFAVTIALGLALGAAAGLLVGIVLTATSLGVVVPVLKDAGEAATAFGQQVIAASSIADFGAIVLLTLFFSRGGYGTGGQLVLLGSFAALAVAIGLAVSRAGRSMRLGGALLRLQDTPRRSGCAAHSCCSSASRRSRSRSDSR